MLETKKKIVSNRLTILLIIVAFSSLSFAIAGALTEYALIKPFVANLVFQDTLLKSEGFTLNFDPETSLYENATVTVKNYGAEQVSATAYVYLYDVDKKTIASGQDLINLGDQQTKTYTIKLTWVDETMASDVATGKITIQEEEG